MPIKWDAISNLKWNCWGKIAVCGGHVDAWGSSGLVFFFQTICFKAGCRGTDVNRWCALEALVIALVSSFIRRKTSVLSARRSWSNAHPITRLRLPLPLFISLQNMWPPKRHVLAPERTKRGMGKEKNHLSHLHHHLMPFFVVTEEISLSLVKVHSTHHV